MTNNPVVHPGISRNGSNLRKFNLTAILALKQQISAPLAPLARTITTKDIPLAYNQVADTIWRLSIPSSCTRFAFPPFGSSAGTWITERENGRQPPPEECACRYQAIKICSKPAKLSIKKTSCIITRQR